MTVATAKAINGTLVTTALFNENALTFYGRQESAMFRDVKVRVIIVDR